MKIRSPQACLAAAVLLGAGTLAFAKETPVGSRNRSGAWR